MFACRPGFRASVRTWAVAVVVVVAVAVVGVGEGDSRVGCRGMGWGVCARDEGEGSDDD